MVTGQTGVISSKSAIRLAHEWLISDPPQIVEMSAGRRVGAGLLKRVNDRIDRLRHMDDFVGGKDLYGNVAKELVATVDLMREASYTEEIGWGLLVAIGELAQLAGWVGMDAGYIHAAERHLLVGAKAAHAGGDASLAANLISTLSYQKINTGAVTDGVVLAKSAYAGSRHSATPKTQALFLDRVAWAHAKEGNFRACERALGSASEAFVEGDRDSDPTWVYWLDAKEMDVMAGRCLTELHRPLRAQPLLDVATRKYTDSQARELSLYLSWLADAYIQGNEIEQACAVATRAVTLAARVSSTRSAARARVLSEKLKPYKDVAEVRQFQEFCLATLPNGDTCPLEPA